METLKCESLRNADLSNESHCFCSPSVTFNERTETLSKISESVSLYFSLTGHEGGQNEPLQLYGLHQRAAFYFAGEGK